MSNTEEEKTVKHSLIGAFAAVVSLAAPAVAQQHLSITTGGTGGVYFPMGGGIAELISQNLEGYSAVGEVSGGTVENMARIFNGDADFAMGIADTVSQAASGTGAFEGRQVPVRTIAAIYAAPMQIVVLDEGPIQTLQDVKGTRFSIGAPGSGNEVNTTTVLGANGISFDDLGRTERLSYTETADGMRDGVVDGGLWASTAPTSSIMSLSASRDLRLIGLSDEEVAAIIEQDESFVPFTMPEGIYPGVEAPVQTVALSNALVAHEDLDEELAYQVTKLLHENAEYLVSIHPAARDMTEEFMVNGASVPLHPGAQRYYEEIGLEIPDRLRP
ncbi:MAG: C4-dicarboxylate ABC transporter substrate-binding protein [Oceanibulbus sp.]|nr:C4-dicarboxylate ABC transporter substrate-binding protein [Sulfitobacter sp.]